jgi:hypothetical protein
VDFLSSRIIIIGAKQVHSQPCYRFAPIAHLFVSCYVMLNCFERFDMPRVRKPGDPISLQVRMTEALRRKLASAAGKNARSLNSEILWRLGQTFDEEWRQGVTEMEDQERRDQEFLERMRQNPRLQANLAELIANLGKGGR